MRISEIREKIGDIPNMSLAQAGVISNVIIENQFRHILELGFKHGASTCYLAGALDELGEGSVTTIDLTTAQAADPNVDQLLDRLGLKDFVTVFYEPTSYLWRLMRMLEEDPAPRFDFCYIDGAHNWFVDGFAFFLVDRLLKPGGLIIFDDLDWTYASSPTLSRTQQVLQMPEDEKNIPQVRQVFELLVKPHPSYVEFMEKGGWAYARKSSNAAHEATGEIRKEVVYQQVSEGVGAIVRRIARKVLPAR